MTKVHPNSIPTAAEFRNPPAAFRPGYFWMLNDALDHDAMRVQLRDMRDSGAGMVCPHPLPPEFRPESMATRMSPEYLGEEYFRHYRRILGECRELGLLCWLYDEGGWPSGGACGRVRALDPERFACKRLEAERKPLEPDESAFVPQTAFCAVLEASGRRRVLAPGDTAKAVGENAVLWTFSVKLSTMPYESAGRHAPYIDILCADAVAAFLSLTHARYAERVGDELGKVVRFAFTDEPAVCYTVPGRQLTWTNDMAAEFEKRKGYALEPLLPDLFSVPADGENTDITRTRVDFYDVWSNMLVERFLAPIKEWCGAHGILSAGHFGGEDDPANNAVHGYGHILRALRGLDLPCVDAIWRQVFPGRAAAPFPLYAASIAAQKGTPLVATESFAVYGAGLTLAQMKWIADFQYALGATLLVPSNYPYSTDKHFMRFCRPQFGPQNPLWKYIDLFHDYIGRLGYMLSRGRSGCRTAVYFDVRGVWAGGKTGAEAARLHKELCGLLLAGRREFEFIDDDALAGRAGRIEHGVLRVGAAAYDTVIVPACRWMEPEALRGLAAFAAGGGTVVAAGGHVSADGGRRGLEQAAGLPALEFPCEMRAGKGRVILRPMEQAALVPAPLFETAPEQSGIRARRRVLPDGSMYFIFNEADKPLSFAAKFQERSEPVSCDLETGLFHPMPFGKIGGAISVRLDIPAWGSALVGFGLEVGSASDGCDAPPRLPALPAAKTLQAGGANLPHTLRRYNSSPGGRDESNPAHELAITDGWTLTPVRSFSTGERNFLITDCKDAAPVPVRLGDWREALGANFSGEALYAASFNCPRELAGRRAMLDMGDVRYACEVLLNGRPAGRRAWRPFVLDLGDMVRAGANELEIKVANTLANAMLDPATRERHSVITGADGVPRELAYEKMVRPFEEESLAGGLFGPVRILFG